MLPTPGQARDGDELNYCRGSEERHLERLEQTLGGIEAPGRVAYRMWRGVGKESVTKPSDPALTASGRLCHLCA